MRFVSVVCPPLDRPLLLEVIKPVQNLVPNSLDPAAPLRVVTQGIVDLAFLSQHERLLNVVGPALVLAVLLAPSQENEVHVEGLLKQPFPEPLENELSPFFLVFTIDAFVFPPIHGLLQPNRNAALERFLDDPSLE